MRSDRSKVQVALWLGAVAVTALSALLLLQAEARYIDFIGSLDDIDVRVRWVGLEGTPERTKLRFAVDFHNTSAHTLWVEAINTQLFVDGEYAGAYSIAEGRHPVPPGELRSVPLEAVLWEARARLLQQALDSPEGRLSVVGRSRVRISIGGTELKVFYPVRGVFPLSALPESAPEVPAPAPSPPPKAESQR